MSGKLTQEEVSKTVDFCLNAWERHAPEKQEAVLRKLEMATLASNFEAPATLTGNVESPATLAGSKTEAEIEKKAMEDPEGLSPDELRILNTIRASQILRREDTMNMDNFKADAINGWSPVVKRGGLGLRKAGGKPVEPTGPAMANPAIANLTGPSTAAIKMCKGGYCYPRADSLEAGEPDL